MTPSTDLATASADAELDRSGAAGRGKMLRRGLGLVVEYVLLHPLPFTLAVSGAVVFAVSLVASSWILGQAVDRVVTTTYETGAVPTGSLRWVVGATFGFAFLRMVGVVARRFFAGMTSERVQVSFRHRLIEHYLGMPLAWYQENPTGELLAIADADTELSVEMIHPLPFSIGAACIALVSLLYMTTIDPYVTLIALCAFPAIALLNGFYGKRMEIPSAAAQATVGQASTVAHESFEGALVVKTLGRAEAEVARFDEASQKLRQHRVEVGYLRALFEPLLDAIPVVGSVAVVVTSAYRIGAGAMTVGDMVTVTSLFAVLSFPVRVFGYFLESVPPSLASRERLSQVLDEPVPTPHENPVPLPAGSLSIEVTGVGFTYPGEPEATLEGVTFGVEAGQVVALVGSTGVGKSTLCQLLAGLIDPVEGAIKLGGVPLSRVSAGERAASIAMVFQEAFLFADSVANNIDLDGGRGAEAIRAASRLARIDEFLHELPEGYDTLLGERGVNLSGGQRQRVALARALVRRPRFLLLDDATSAVDPKIEQEILAGLRQELATTTIVVAQRVATIALADRVLYLADGTIAAAGSHEELMDHPGYRALVSAYESDDR